jgi:aryl-alcohol dehydrogenase-like predicted oxidoreductase
MVAWVVQSALPGPTPLPQMHSRVFGRTGRTVSEIGLGTWQLGAGWGDVSDADALKTLQAAYETGVTFFDTADVYGMGRSESLIGKFLRETPGARERIYVATKLGRRDWPNGFTRAKVTQYVEDSLRHLGVDCLDLTQTHCVPLAVMRDGAMFGYLDDLVKQGKLKAYGASVESMEEADICVRDGRCVSLQIIFNLFRQKPIATLFEAALRQKVALIVRLPLASGLLAGKFSAASTFAANDHRTFNRDGQQFNVGETFAGLPFAKGVALADALKPRVPAGWTMAEWTIRWCLDFRAVSVVIPGARNPEQARGNASASARPPLSPAEHAVLAEFYCREVTAHIRGPY